jgi:hypothetical protein
MQSGAADDAGGGLPGLVMELETQLKSNHKGPVKFIKFTPAQRNYKAGQFYFRYAKKLITVDTTFMLNAFGYPNCNLRFRAVMS